MCDVVLNHHMWMKKLYEWIEEWRRINSSLGIIAFLKSIGSKTRFEDVRIASEHNSMDLSQIYVPRPFYIKSLNFFLHPDLENL